jgi:hypothetical protein
VCFYFIHFLSYNSFLGSDCDRPWNTWCHACSDHSWKWQDYGFCRYR